MFNTAAQSITKKAPQAARIQRNITAVSDAFYPVRKTRYDQAIPTAMWPATKRAPQVARMSTSAGHAESHSFAFYPVQKNRVRVVTPKTKNRDCFGYYPANVETQTLQASSIKDVKAVPGALRENKQATPKIYIQNWDSIMKELRAVKKATSA